MSQNIDIIIAYACYGTDESTWLLTAHRRAGVLVSNVTGCQCNDSYDDDEHLPVRSVWVPFPEGGLSCLRIPRPAATIVGMTPEDAAEAMARLREEHRSK